MKIIRESLAGTLESSDALVAITPQDSGITLEINSSVGQQFYEQIEATVREVLKELKVNAVALRLEDKGALDCVLRARIKAALLRASDASENWEILL